MKKKLICAVLSALISASAAGNVSAQQKFLTENYSGEKEYRLLIDGYDYDGEVIFVSGTTYVALREFSCMADNAIITWDDEDECAYVKTDSLELSAEDGGEYIDANGRLLWCEDGIFTYDDKMYVPLRQISAAFGFDVYYDAEKHTTYLTRLSSAIVPEEEFYDHDELYWLSKLIYAESGAEPFLGKLAVGTVVMNRVDSDEFPSNIVDVIFDKENGVQFTPTANGAIEKDPDEDSIAAAKICLEDVRLSDDILYFLNEKLSSSLWIVENCTYVMTIGSHDFYAD